MAAMMASKSLLLVAMALLALSSCTAAQIHDLDVEVPRILITEVGEDLFHHASVACNPLVLGSIEACFDSHVKAQGNIDYLFGTPEVAFPTNGSPWGVRMTGPYPDGTSYMISWNSFGPMVGNASSLTEPNTTNIMVQARLSTSPNAAASGRSYTVFTGKALTYKRVYLPPTAGQTDFTAWSYVSPVINHVLLEGLRPKTTYYYRVGDGQMWSQEMSFSTLADVNSKDSDKYPLRIGLMADVGQTTNSSLTRDYMAAHMPDVIIMPGDYTYADTYGPNSVNISGGRGTNQRRWDTWNAMWSSLTSRVPVLACQGNHEIEDAGIAARLDYTTTNFSYPTNYAFQSHSARFPVPGTQLKDVGNIDNNLYYSTVVGGVIKLITLNNYVPFHQGTPQYKWVMAELAAFNRKETPWLFVQYHAPAYHSYEVHFKEMECFQSVYEEMFYQYGVDLVINGHVHAYERTHPVYKYKVDTCAPMYITIGDGGNLEGPYRNFVDEVNPATNKTYCEGLRTGGRTPQEIAATNGSLTWGPNYQTRIQAPGCPTVSYQPANNVMGGPALVLAPNSTDGFCQSSQPEWSAYRDPSFGHAILDVVSDMVMKFAWYRNIDGGNTTVDMVTLQRTLGCPSRKPNARKMFM